MTDLGPYGFAGGLNTKTGPYTLGKDQYVLGQNVHVLYGKLTKINGSAKINSSALNSGATVTGIVDWQTVAQNRYLVVVVGDDIQQSQNLGATFTDITSVATVTAGNLHTFASLNNILAICGGTDTPLQWTGTGNVSSLAGSPPTTSLCTTANNFMFLSGNATNPSRVYWSNAGDPGTWTGANNIDFRASDGDIVTAIAPMGFNLAIFKRRSTGILYTQTTSVSGAVTLAPLTQVSTSIGCAGPLAWDTLPDGRLVVMGWDNHLRIFDGTSFIDISDQPIPHSNIQPNFDAFNPAVTGNVSVKFYPTLNQVWVAAATGSNTTNDSIFIYDYLYNTWQCNIPDRAANVLATSIDSRATPHHPIVMLSGDYGGFIYEHDTGATNAQATTGLYTGSATVCIPFGADSTDFIPRALRIAVDAQSSSGAIQVGWGFNDLISTPSNTFVSDTQVGATLDTTFFLDSSMLSGGQIIFQDIVTPNSARAYMEQVQFLKASENLVFAVHPFYISDEDIR